ncbi:MAG: hypothetical protein AABW52_04145 [Nanoarchaeota archaeon]
MVHLKLVRSNPLNLEDVVEIYDDSRRKFYAIIFRYEGIFGKFRSLDSQDETKLKSIINSLSYLYKEESVQDQLSDILNGRILPEITENYNMHFKIVDLKRISRIYLEYLQEFRR